MALLDTDVDALDAALAPPWRAGTPPAWCRGRASSARGWDGDGSGSFDVSKRLQLLPHRHGDLNWVGNPHGVGNNFLALDDDLAVTRAVVTMATAAALGRVEVDGNDVDCVGLRCWRGDYHGGRKRRRRCFVDWRRRRWEFEDGRRRWRELDKGGRGHLDDDGGRCARRRHDGGDGAADCRVSGELRFKIESLFVPAGSFALESSHVAVHETENCEEK